MASGVLPYEQYKVIVKNGSLSGTNYSSDVTYTVSGSGIIVVFASMVSTANQYGQWMVDIQHNSSTVMAEGTRWATSNSSSFGSSACVPINVVNGDKIRIYLYNSKDGAKSIYRRFLCIGNCSI